MTENTSADYAHQWQAATIVPVTDEQIRDMIAAAALGETPSIEQPAGTELDVLALNCRRCMRLFADAENEPCTPVPMP